MIKALLLKIFREGVGRLIVFVSFLTNPRKIKRDPAAQLAAVNKAESMALYQYYTCPFCIKTRRAIHRLNVPIEYRNAQIRGGEHRNALEQQGKEIKVPCLRIDEGEKTTWMYESKNIINYLNRKFDPALESAANR